METDLILALKIFLIAVIALLPTPTYLLAVFKQDEIIRNGTSGKWTLKLYSLLVLLLFNLCNNVKFS